MNNRKGRILNNLLDDKHLIESLIMHDKDKIEARQKSLTSRRYELARINDLIRKLVKK